MVGVFPTQTTACLLYLYLLHTTGRGCRQAWLALALRHRCTHLSASSCSSRLAQASSVQPAWSPSAVRSDARKVWASASQARRGRMSVEGSSRGSRAKLNNQTLACMSKIQLVHGRQHAFQPLAAEQALELKADTVQEDVWLRRQRCLRRCGGGVSGSSFKMCNPMCLSLPTLGPTLPCITSREWNTWRSSSTSEPTRGTTSDATCDAGSVWGQRLARMHSATGKTSRTLP